MSWLSDLWRKIFPKHEEPAPSHPPPHILPPWEDQPAPVVPPAPAPSLILCGPMRTRGEPLKVLPVSSPVPGIDVSHWQPNMNWDVVAKAGFQFVFAKASDGVGTKAAHYDSHRAEATKRGLLFGSYHFVRFGGLSAEDEAARFLAHTGGRRPGELPSVIDVEWDKTNAHYTDGKTMDEAAAAEALEILERVEEVEKVTPIIYTSYPFFCGFKNPERFFRFLPWLPAYRVDGPKVPLPWSSWAFWQWTDKHPLARQVTGDPNLDANYFNGSIEQLRRLAK